MSYWECFVMLLIARSADILSTRMVTPTLLMEANWIMRKLGWRGALLMNLLLVAGLALSEKGTIVMSVASILVAFSNTYSAWLVKGIGERPYYEFTSSIIKSVPLGIYARCIFTNAAFAILLAATIAYLGDFQPRIMAVAWGIFAYAAAVTFHRLFRL